MKKKDTCACISSFKMEIVFKIWWIFFIIYMKFFQAFATDPIFKFIPQASLDGLTVQSIVTLDVVMVTGTTTSTPAIFTINGPMTNGHAGMTVKSFEKKSKGSNVDSPDFDTASTTTTSTSKDGLHDVGIKNFSKIVRSSQSTTATDVNQLNLLAKMTVVDTPGAVSSDKMWLWASAELGDEYVWVGEERTTVSRSASDRAYLNYTADVNGRTELSDPTITGSINIVSGSIKHHQASRINAYNTAIQFFLPPYAEYVTGSFTGDSQYSTAVVTMKSQNNENQLTILYPKIGITDLPSYSFHMRFKGSKLHLLEHQNYNGTLRYLMSYCSKTTCTASSIQEKFTTTLLHKFQNRDDLNTFKLQHVPSGRCFSYSSGQNDNKVILKAACSDQFTYDENGGLKHVSSSACAYLDNSGNLKMLQSKCNALDAAIITKGVNGKLLLKMPRTDYGNCIVQDSFGAAGEGLKNGSCSTKDNNFRYLETLPGTARLPISNKAILIHHSAGLIFFCSRHKPVSRPPCYFSKSSIDWQALPSSLAVIKSYNTASSTVYGIHSSGKGYVKVSLNQDPLITYQLEDTLWDSAKAKSDSILSSEFSDAALTDAPSPLQGTNYAVSLTGIHVTVDNVWKLIARW